MNVNNKKFAIYFLDKSILLKINVLDFNDNFPIFESFPGFFVSEESPLNSTIGVVFAKDADFGLNSMVQYRILPESLPYGEFIIDPLRGYLQVIF